MLLPMQLFPSCSWPIGQKHMASPDGDGLQPYIQPDSEQIVELSQYLCSSSFFGHFGSPSQSSTICNYICNSNSKNYP